MTRSQFTENQALDADFVSHQELDTVSGTLKTFIDSKAPDTHNHNSLYYTKSESDAIHDTLTLSGGGLSDAGFVSPDEHEGLHDRDTYIEIIRVNNKVTNVDEWKDESKTFKYSSTAISRSNNKINVVTKTIYDYATGTSGIATVTTTLNRTNNKVTSVSISRDNDMEGL